MNILLGLMSLDIGGAETHVVTLAEALKANGHTVVVASGGGIYEEALKTAGIPHVYAPLGQKSPGAVVSSVKAIRKAIKDFNIEIVHTHGRIPSLMGGIVSKLMGRKFMTTVHAMYKLNSYKWLSLYGEKTICISEDVKDHVVKHYNVSEDQITVIPNCIDVKKFAPTSKEASKTFTVGYISRMENALADRAIEVAGMLSTYAYEKNRLMRVLIVGDGPDFNRVVTEINQLCKRLADEYGDKKIEIQILGKRIDIPQIINQTDAVVCVSRVAMEAMSCAKPVVLLGGEGYESLLTPENYNHAKASNFTGRTSQMIFGEAEFIGRMNELVESEERRLSLGKWGRERILAEYSIDEIVKETIQVYKTL